jgi:hypothetical protein
MAKQDNLTDFLVDVADAIREKKGSSEKINPQNFSEEIRSIESGQVTEVEEKDINFYDYDGTLLFSYTIPEAQALTELPTPKGHSGLIFDGWNWDYEDVIALDYPMDIGAMYRTDDGKTRLYINVITRAAMDVPLYFSQSVDRGVVIDWGDGTSNETIEGTGYLSITHHYNDVGEYCISLDVVEGCLLTLGSNQANVSILGLVRSSSPLTYATYLDKVELGYRVAFTGNTFKYSLLTSIAIPKDCGFSSSSAFYGVSRLKALVLPRVEGGSGTNQFTNAYSIRYALLPKITNNSGGIANNCENLKHIRLADSIKVLSPNSLRGCYSISGVLIPSSLTALDAYAIYSMYSLRLLDFRRCKQIPINKGNNDIPSDTIVVVPDELYDEWKIATNWSGVASQIMKASDYESIYG